MKIWFNGLQALRAILFVVVFISHSGAFINVPGHLGSIGVSSFFILSGFLSALHAFKTIPQNNSSKQFLKTIPQNNSSKQFLKTIFKEQIKNIQGYFAKFYPLYLLFLIVAIPFKPTTFGNFMKCAALLQSYFFDANTALLLNWPSWFLSSLMFCYLIAPIINKLLKNRTKTFYILFSVFLFVITVIWSCIWKNEPEAYGRGYYYVYIFPPARVIDFSLGSIMSFYFTKYRSSERQESIIPHIAEVATILMLFLSIVIVDVILGSERYADMYRIFVYTAVYLPSSFLLVWIFADERGFITKILSNSAILQSLGKMSFELYIVHRMILLFFAHFKTTVLYWSLSIITTFIVAKMFVVIKDFIHLRKT